MQPPRLPVNESERLFALYEHALLDTPAEERFDRITRLAQQMFGVEIALVSLVDAERQWFKSRQGLDACETGRDISFCGHAILGKDIFHIPNASLDPRFADNPLVTGAPNIRFYAGAPLKTSDGQSIGTLCIIDSKPRQLSPQELATLRDLADVVESEINRRQQERQHNALLTLAEITSLNVSEPQALLRTALTLGCRYLGLPFGIISRIQGDNYTVQVQVSPPGTLSDNQHFPLGQTYCSLTLKNDDVLAINHMGKSEYASHPCYQSFGLESYIGVALRMEGMTHGTLNFSSPEPRSPSHFTKAEIEFVHLLSRWVSTTIQRWQLDQTLQQEQYLSDTISRAQDKFISTVDRQLAFDSLLTDLLALTQSEYGFIGEVLHNIAGEPYLKTYAITNIAWNNETRAFYDANAPQGMEFYNLKSLFGSVMTSGEPVIANDPCHDPRRGGLPEGHPSLNAFLGIPIHHDNDMVAMIGIANRPGGYDYDLIAFLQPLLMTIGQLVKATRIERQHSESKRRLADVIEGTNIGTWEWNIQTGATVFNERWANIVGYTLAELEPISIQTWMDHAHPDDLKQSSILLKRHFAGELTFYDVQGRMRHKNGHWVWIHDRGRVVSWTDDGKPLLMSGSHADITERKLAENEINQFKNTLDRTLDCVFMFDASNLQFFYVNEGALQQVGYSRDELLTMHPFDIKPDISETQFRDRIKPLLTGQQPSITFETVHQHKHGQRISVEIFLQYIAPPDEAPRFVAIVRDITERKRIDRMKSEFVSTVSHELRTPLTSISGALGLLNGGVLGQLPEKAQTMIDIAHKNSQRLTFLINDLLDMEKLIAGKMQFDMQQQPLLPLIEQALEANRAYGAERQVRLTLANPIPDINVYVDNQRFMQVLSNLLSNAIKYSPENDIVTINMETRDQTVRVAVTDHGLGIPTAFHNRIFQKFAQADSSDARQKGGTGLGLAITRELVERMGGQIGFESVEGHGASFFFDLPVTHH
jgi:PAS domain S-box-containing protein